MSVVQPGQVPAGYEGNDPIVEQAFAMKAIKHADSFFNLCKAVKASSIGMTLHSEAGPLLQSFKEGFPEFFENGGAKLQKINEETDMKSPAAKEKWRKWIKPWEKLEDYNFGTLLRADSKGEYSEENSMFVTRIQFLVIEIARSTMGMNDWIHEQGK